MAQGSNSRLAGLLTVRQAAAALGVGEETVRRYIRSRRLKAKMMRAKGMSKVWMIAREDLEAFRNL